MLVADYTFLDFFWSMLVFFLWIMWFWLLFGIWSDIFRRDDLSGWGKTLWLVFTIVLPFLGTFVYLIAENDGMTKRSIERNQKQRDHFDQYVRETAGGGGGAAAEIERGKALLDGGRDHAGGVRRPESQRARLEDDGDRDNRGDGARAPLVLGAFRDADADPARIAPRGAGDRARARLGRRSTASRFSRTQVAISSSAFRRRRAARLLPS